jgi:glycosyltransferase involved in cell wall biosynthesis
MKLMKHIYPKISIVTPSYNQGQFLEQTILSVLGQNYPKLEYIIIDGGSTDNSIEIIKKYETQLKYWISEKDSGQCHAINKGFKIATGEIFGWLNSDDLYFPGIFNNLIDMINTKETGIYIGECIHFKYEDEILSCRGSNVAKNFSNGDLTINDFIIQPSSFWTSLTWEKVGSLNEKMHYTFDWEWFIRAKNQGIPFIMTSQPLSLYRIHNLHKSLIGGSKRQLEIIEIYSQFNPGVKRLYENLCSENFLINSYFIKSINFTLKQFSLSPITGLFLKTFKFYKYYQFSIRNINTVSAML